MHHQIRRVRPLAACLALCGALTAGIARAESEAPGATPPDALPRVELMTVLQHVTGAPAKHFAIDAAAPSRIVVGTLDASGMSYPVLLTVLGNNGLTAVHTAGLVNVIPLANVRHYALPIVTNLDENRPDDEWVTFAFRPKHAVAAALVPILRPMIPAAGNLAAIGDENTLIFVDRFANLRRLVQLIRGIDTAWAADQ